MTVYEDVCSCVPFAVSTLYKRVSSRCFLYVCDSCRQFMLAIMIHICDSCWRFTFATRVYNHIFCIIIIITLWVNSADNNLIFFLILPENRHLFSFKWSHGGTLCLKSQTCLLEKEEKHFKMLSAEFFSQRAKH